VLSQLERGTWLWTRDDAPREVLQHQHPQWGESGGTTASIIGRGRQREETQTAAHQASSKHMSTSIEVPTNELYLATAGHTAAQLDWGRVDRKRKGSSSHGMQKWWTEATSKEFTCCTRQTLGAVISVTGGKVQDVSPQNRGS
jgi:hypothetical protein